MPYFAKGPANVSTALVRDVTASSDAGSSIEPTSTSIFPAACGCFSTTSSRTRSSLTRSRPAMAQRTGSEAAAGLLEPGVYRRAKYSAAKRPVKPLPPQTTRSYTRAIANASPRGVKCPAEATTCRFHDVSRRTREGSFDSPRFIRSGEARFLPLPGLFVPNSARSRFERILLTVPRRPHKDGTSRSVRHRSPGAAHASRHGRDFRGKASDGNRAGSVPVTNPAYAFRERSIDSIPI